MVALRKPEATFDLWRRAPEPGAPRQELGASSLTDILRGWRAAERALDEVSDQAREAAVLQREVDAWRSAYHRLSARLRNSRAESQPSRLIDWRA